MKVIAFDLDDVLCFRSQEHESLGIGKYNYCQPITKFIDIMNHCYDSGFYIKIYTARGMTQLNGDVEEINKKLKELTESQLLKWGAKYHELIFGKTHYDILIDDKAWNSADINFSVDITNKLK
jgi:hypothetical protein